MGDVNIGLLNLRTGGATAAANASVNERCWKDMVHADGNPMVQNMVVLQNL